MGKVSCMCVLYCTIQYDVVFLVTALVVGSQMWAPVLGEITRMIALYIQNKVHIRVPFMINGNEIEKLRPGYRHTASQRARDREREGGGGGRERERDGQTDRHTHTHTQPERQTHRQRGREIDREERRGGEGGGGGLRPAQ